MFGAAGAQKSAAHAARRFAGYLGRCRGPGARRRIPAGHGFGNGCEALRRMVSWVLPSAILEGRSLTMTQPPMLNSSLPEWAAVGAHAAELGSAHLRDLTAADPQRWQSFHVAH